MASAAASLSPLALFAHLGLIGQMAKREVAARYRGSVLGVLWSLITPLLMVAVYTFVFGAVLGARAWHAPGLTTTAPFALILFSGLIAFTIFAEVVGKAPMLIVSNRNFVKKVVFPLQILPVVTLGAALVQALISYALLLVLLFATTGQASVTWLWLPVVLAPLILLALACGWVLAALGVYLRDLTHIVPTLLSAVMFLSAIVYPLSALPEHAQRILTVANPLVFPIEQVRRVLIYNEQPIWWEFALYSAVAFVLAVLGYAFFQKLRKGFADVV